MDCFASSLGQTALRCDGLSAEQSRLLMLPATLFFIGALVIFANWIRLVLAGRLFRLDHLVSLFVYGLLVFSLAVADQRHPVSKQEYVNSRVIGGISILATFFFVVCVCFCLPPRVVLPFWVDRLVVATSCAALITGCLGSIAHFTPDGVPYETKINIYASSAFMIAFLVSSLIASQNSRFFSIFVNVESGFKAFVSLDRKSNYLFIAMLVISVIQTCFMFVRPAQFIFTFAESVLASIAYILLVAISILLNLPTKVSAVSVKKEKEEQRQEEEGNAQTSGQDNSSNIHIAVQDDQGNNVPYRRERTNTGHQSQLSNPESAEGTVVYNGFAFSEAVASGYRPHSCASASTFPQLEAIMRGRQVGPFPSSPLRPTSGITAYGSEASFVDCDTVHRRSSYLSAMIGHGHVPPVPPLDANFIRNFSGTSTSLLSAAQYAKPLTHGEVPIPLYPVCSTSSNPIPSPGPATVGPQKSPTPIPNPKDFYWHTEDGKKEGPGPYVKQSVSTGQSSWSDQSMFHSSTEGSNSVNHTSTLISKASVSNDSKQSAMMNRYRNPKLFPNMIVEQEEVGAQALRSQRSFQTEHSNKTFDQQLQNVNGFSKDTMVESAEKSVSQEPNTLTDTQGIKTFQSQTLNTFDSDQTQRNTVLSQVFLDNIEKNEKQLNRTKRSIPNLSTIVEPQPVLPIPRSYGNSSPTTVYPPLPSNISVSGSPRELVFKETRHARDDSIYVDIPTSAVSPPPSSPPGKKVNRGKVLRKQDSEEDNRVRIAGSIRFPATAY